MFLSSKPKLQILNKSKLHISRKPGLKAWLLLGISVIAFVGISRWLTDNAFFLIVLVLGELMCGLDALGEWEDLILDKELNRAVVARSTWNGKLCSRISDRSATILKLTDIRHVGVSMEMGLFLLLRDGTTVKISVRGLTRDEIQNLKKEINYFLNMSRIEYFDYYPIDPYGRLLNDSDSDEECLKNFSGDATENHTTRCPIQQIFSTPALGSSKRNANRQHTSLRRGPYTDNSNYSNCPRCMRHNCTIARSFGAIEDTT